jgi:hypothetical protein
VGQGSILPPSLFNIKQTKQQPQYADFCYDRAKTKEQKTKEN